VKGKAKTVRIILVALLLIVGAICAISTLSSKSTPVPTPRKYEVTYRVQGTTDQVSLTYENKDGSTEQHTVNVPWYTKFSAERGQFVYLSAQNERERGNIIATVIVDGLDWKEAKSDGAYCIATVSGRIGE